RWAQSLSPASASKNGETHELLSSSRPFSAKPNGYDSKDAERAINQPPIKRNPSDRAKNKGVRNDHNARDHPKSEQPNIADRIAQRADEGNRDNKMSEGQPVSTVKKERVLVGHE